MKNKKIIFLAVASIAIFLFVLFILLSFKNSKNCNQLVIDTYEIVSGIDIPKQTTAECFYVEEERIRLGIYSVSNPQNFIDNYDFKKLEDRNEYLWSQNF